MTVRQWIEDKFEEVGRDKDAIYRSYDEICDDMGATVNYDTFSRTIRKVYNDIYGTTDGILVPEEPTKVIYTNMGNVLVIGDMHEPFAHEGYLEFCKSVYRTYKCKTVVFIGDIIDNHGLSYHEHDPDGLSAGNELKLCIVKLQKWYDAFPKAFVCMGNHDLLIERKAKTNGLPRYLFKSFSEIIKAPKGWKFNYSWQIDGVKYMHGTGGGGQYAYIHRSLKNRQSTVLGHFHTTLGVKYMTSHHDRIFGLSVGCGINVNAYAMAYAKDFIERPVLGCGVVLDNGKTAIPIPMEL